MQTDCANVVDVEHLAKQFGHVVALVDLTLHVRKGEIFGFLGPNGAGKTTSVKLLAGLARPSAGSGTLLGYPLGDRRARRRLGYLPELFRYHDWLTAREVLALHARLIGERVHVRDLDAALQTVGLRARAGDRVGTFSKGMQQRLGLAVALLGNPELVILDEPTSALDPAGRLEVREILRGLRDRGVSVFLNSHLLTEVEKVCDRIAIVTRGRVVAQGTIPEIAGASAGVRVRVRENGTPLTQALAEYGPYTRDGEHIFAPEVHVDRIPALVAALVAAGAQVYAVEPASTTLEERFLQLTQERGA